MLLRILVRTNSVVLSTEMGSRQRPALGTQSENNPTRLKPGTWSGSGLKPTFLPKNIETYLTKIVFVTDRNSNIECRFKNFKR